MRGLGAVEKSDGVGCVTPSSKPDHDFVLGIGGAGRLVPVIRQEHVYGDVRVDTGLGHVGVVGLIVNVVPETVCPLDVNGQGGQVGQQYGDGIGQQELGIGKCMHRCRSGARRIVPCRRETCSKQRVFRCCGVCGDLRSGQGGTFDDQTNEWG